MAINRHILLLSFPSQGSLNPCLQLAKNLLRLGVKVTLVTTVSTGRCLSTTSEALEGLTIATFSDGYDDGFKIGHHDPHHFLSELKNQGSLALTNLITTAAQGGLPVTGLVYSMNQPWPADVARGFNIPAALLWTQPANVFDIYFYYFNGYGDAIKKLGDDISSSIQFPGLPKLTSHDLPSFLAPSNSNSYNIPLPLSKEQVDVESNPKVLVNTFEALESEALRSIEKLNLIPIGPLVPSTFLDRKHSVTSATGNYIDWLDSKPQSSVVYAAFGTVAVLTKRQMEEIGQGLLRSGRPFLWVTRDFVDGEELSCIEELKKSRLGLIVPWCSQVEVLSHPSLGCFVTHCGWNSSLESLVCGVPVVGIPQFTDQPTNAKLFEDVFGSGVRAKANEEGIVEGKEIKRCLEMVMGGGKEGEEMRRNAKKWKDLAREAIKEGGSSYNNLKDFVDGLEEGSLLAA